MKDVITNQVSRQQRLTSLIKGFEDNLSIIAILKHNLNDP